MRCHVLLREDKPSQQFGMRQSICYVPYLRDYIRPILVTSHVDRKPRDLCIEYTNLIVDRLRLKEGAIASQHVQLSPMYRVKL